VLTTYVYTTSLTFGKSAVCSHNEYRYHTILRITNIVFPHNSNRSAFAAMATRYFCEAFVANSMRFHSNGKLTTSDAQLLCLGLRKSNVSSVLRDESGLCSCSSCCHYSWPLKCRAFIDVCCSQPSGSCRCYRPSVSALQLMNNAM
jgi:hypothetical protein